MGVVRPRVTAMPSLNLKVVSVLAQLAFLISMMLYLVVRSLNPSTTLETRLLVLCSDFMLWACVAATLQDRLQSRVRLQWCWTSLTAPLVLRWSVMIGWKHLICEERWSKVLTRLSETTDPLSVVLTDAIQMVPVIS